MWVMVSPPPLAGPLGDREVGPRGIVPGKPAAIVLHQGIVYHIHHHNVIML